jgi:Fe-S oxidoreductase
VLTPSRPLCCGRPLYDYGFLDRARAQLAEILDVLGPQLEAGIPIVVLEPSCLAVFHDELVNLFPDDPRAARLARQSLPLAAFLRRHVPGYRAPALGGPALLHGHCHAKATGGFDEERALLADMTPQLTVLDSGCCGMAGSFGFEASHVKISRDIGELVLLPAVRQAAAETLIVTDGFSCREQIAQETGRRAMHLAEVMAAALSPRERSTGPAEDVALPARPSRPSLWAAAAALVVAAGVAGAALALVRGWRT